MRWQCYTRHTRHTRHTRPHLIRPERGFTLIEIMISLLIIGILLGMATLSLRNDSGNRNLKKEIGMLRHNMILAAREAVINHQEIGLRISAHDYQFLSFNEQQQWVVPPGDPFFRPHSLPANSTLILHVEGQRITLPPSPAGLPQLFFFSSGEQIPFQMEIHTSNLKRFQLSGDLNGSLHLSQPNSQVTP